MSKQQKSATKPAKKASPASTKSEPTTPPDENSTDSEQNSDPTTPTSTQEPAESKPSPKSQERERVSNADDDGNPTDHGTSNPTGTQVVEGDAGMGREPSLDVAEGRDIVVTKQGKDERSVSVQKDGPVDNYTAENTRLWKALPDPGAPKGRILGPDEEDKFEAKEVEGTNMVEVTEDVYRKVEVRGIKRPMHVLIHRKGEHVPKTAVQSMSHQDEDVQDSTDKTD